MYVGKHWGVRSAAVLVRLDSTYAGVITCAPNEFRCTGGGCVALSWQCDGDRDCSDGSDEQSCRNFVATWIGNSSGHDLVAVLVATVSSCPADKFFCDTHQCISASWRCDGDNDCGDNSDERGCSK